MTVEEIRGNMGTENGNYDNFPVGMKVLAVDDDPLCLKLLETLLRKCEYHVTTTSEARMALNMLRENKDRFDLVISDVHMPDMDGFKLLELVGLEMDLPVIMLSGNSDPKLVMKGITHGACDYLVKPVRIEELRNIWQHVIRRKKFDSKNQNKSTDQDTARFGGGDGCGQIMKVNKKRKDEEDDSDDNENENEDPTAQKKPRVVWSIDLHRKFVAAVNQLGIEKAVPKRILDLMNVDGLTRENVASHLQKYRLYLKRISSVATQQANMVAAFGGKESAYMRLGSLDGLGDFRTLAGSGRFTHPSLSSYPPSGMLGRLNSAAGVNIRNLNLPQNLSQSFGTLGKLGPSTGPAVTPNASWVPPLELVDPLQQSDLNPLGGSTLLGAANTTFPDPSSGVGLIAGGVGIPQALNVVSLNSDPFNLTVSGSSNFPDHGRSSENWQNTIQVNNFQPVTETFNHTPQLTQNCVRESSSSVGPRLQGSCPMYSCTASTSVGPERLVGDAASQSTINHVATQQWGEHSKLNNHKSNAVYGNTISSRGPVNNIVPQPLTRIGVDQCDDLCNNRVIDACGESSMGPSFLLQHNKNGNLTPDSRAGYYGEYLFEPPKPNEALPSPGFGSIDDLMMSSVIKQEQDEGLLEGEFGFDPFPFGSCI
ncbi:unnamed protein product [Cuscuta epithymum]|uniref:Two-component response regulator n=1 Tax=Cuscuta epithymum TaxID=186058 RepID=A0AAV0CY01_9ASTE|nr:unnamed protein product [Cuscuta epithymum]